MLGRMRGWVFTRSRNLVGFLGISPRLGSQNPTEQANANLGKCCQSSGMNGRQESEFYQSSTGVHVLSGLKRSIFLATSNVFGPRSF